MIYALVRPNDTIDRRASGIDPTVQTKAGWRWLPVQETGNDTFDPVTHKITGPVTTVGASSVTDAYTVVLLSAQEISDRKDVAVNGLNGSTYKPLLSILLTLANDTRAIRAKLNAHIDATGQAATVPKFPNNQTTQIDMTQLKAAIKALI